MESTNTFNNGQNSDISKVFHSKDSYLQALNFRGITENGASTGSLVNIKGNECKISYPQLQPVYKLRVTPTGIGNTSGQVTITVNGSSTATLDINSATTGYVIYTALNLLGGNFTVAYNDDYVVIYQITTYTDCGPTPISADNVISISLANPSTATHTLKFVKPDNTTQSTQTAYVNWTGDLITIGSTFIGEEIYLLTAPDDPNYGPQNTPELPVNDSFTGTGQIWKLVIDDITRQATLTLLYNNYLDFTKYHPVAPSAITGRYESTNIKRIYWTDFYNKIKTINVGDPQLMAVDAKLISVTPSVEFTQAILDAIILGSLPVGCYQLAYRLTQDLGSVTNYSEVSNPVYLLAKSIETDPFEDYQGSPPGTNSTRGIQWIVNNLDTTFDKIELVVLFRNHFNDIPTITLVSTQPIPNTGSLTFSYTSLSNTATTISLDDFLILSGAFTHAKTVDTKDNRLFWGNVKAVRKSLDNWDSRAFRCQTSGGNDIILTNAGVSATYTLSQAEAILETEDAINEYYDVSGNPSSNACYYKPGSTHLGGKGTNISYEFGTVSMQADIDPALSTTYDWYYDHDVPFRETLDDRINQNTNLEIQIPGLLNNYPNRGQRGGMKYPVKAGLLKGYQHEEIYRFGIQFFDLEGNPFFTKWIGDIKFPSYNDVNNNPDSFANSAGVTDFRLMFTAGDGKTYLQSMYIKFDVDITAIQDIIGGYEIVRVERLDTNKTIWGCGLITPFIGVDDDPSSTELYLPANFKSTTTQFQIAAAPVGNYPYYRPYPSQEHVETLNTTESSTLSYYKTFDCFDHVSGYNRPSFGSTDKILVRARLVSINYRVNGAGYIRIYSRDNHGGGAGTYPGAGHNLYYSANNPVLAILNNQSPYDYFEMPYYLNKLNYDTGYADATNNYNSNIYRVNEATYSDGGDQSVTFGSYVLHNKGRDMNVTSGPTAHSQQGDPCYGSATIIMHLTDGLETSSSPYNCTVPGDNAATSFYKLLALYYKPNANLYGGFTYTARTNNEYIQCSEYVPTVRKKLHINTNISLTVFGGDVYTSYWDHQKIFKGPGSGYRYYNINSGGTTTGTSAGNANYSTTFFFPCTNMANQEVRDGVHINRDLTSNTYASEDNYTYYDYHSCENDIKKYFPKPLNFVLKDEWINRVYYSQLKYNNETQDSWSVYLTNDFYDVEGNYGAINALVSLRDKMYYIQDRGFGVLLINPVSLTTDQNGQSIKLGQGKTIERHDYYSIDVGTKHQWSVYRSQNQIAFLDVRHKKLYTFNGQELNPISDTLGQRNFIIKRLHDILLTTDNPIINRGVLTTYDYYHNEFLFTFNNQPYPIDNQNYYDNNAEYYTIALSEITGKFTSMYSFVPNIYINNNRYLLSTTNNTKNSLYLHNYGDYCKFYNVQYPATLKLLVNDNPKYTKIFDNLSWESDSIKDNTEWSDELNIYPGAIVSPPYPDDVNFKEDTFNEVRCYNDYQNSDFIVLDPNDKYSVRRVERSWNIQVPRNKFNYDINNPSMYSIFDPTRLTKLTFGERLRDKYLIVDLKYNNTYNNRFVIHNVNSTYRISDR